MKKLLTYVIVLVSCTRLNAQEGISCEEAISVSEGTYEATEVPVWYSYTIPVSDKRLVISSVGLTNEDTYLAVYADCNDSLITSSDDYEGFQSQVSIHDLSEGKTIYILWADIYSSEPFSWKISLEDPVFGEDCQSPDSAKVGPNDLPETSLDVYWYKFLMPESGSKIIITSDTNTEVYGLVNDCNDLDFLAVGNGNMTITEAVEGQEILIIWALDGEGGDFEWNLAIEELDTAEGCQTAKIALTGTNEVPETSFDFYWFEYTMEEEGSKIVVDAGNEGIDIAAFSACGESNPFTEGYNDLTIYDIGEGETVYIVFYTYDGTDDFTWSLSLEALQAGESCGMALALNAGTNLIEGTDLGQQWYTFDFPAEEGKTVIFQPDEFVFMELYQGVCEDLNLTGGGDIIRTSNYIPGSVGYLLIDTENIEGDLSIEMMILDLVDGDVCSRPIDVGEGAQVISGPNATGEHWFRFSMPDPDSKVTIYSETDFYMEIYTGDCDNLSSYSGGQRVTLVDLEEEEEILIYWYMTDFDWYIEVTPLQDGDRCDLAVDVTLGEQVTTHLPYWYRYEVQYEDRDITIQTEDFNRTVNIYRGCMGEWITYEVDFVDDYIIYTIPDVEPGQELLIQWDSNLNEPFSWKLNTDPQLHVLETGTEEVITLRQNYPNPFSDFTRIPYTVSARSEVRLSVHALDGSTVYQQMMETPTRGNYHFEWDGYGNQGRLVQNGTYIYTIEISNSKHRRLTGRMIIQRG